MAKSYYDQIPIGLDEHHYRRIIFQLLLAIDPNAPCICEDGSKTLASELVRTCAYHSGKTWWMVRQARQALGDLNRS